VVQELSDLLAQVVMSNVNDGWVWSPGKDGVFTVKSTYVLLDNLLYPRSVMSPLELFGFKFIWKSGVPSKVSALCWQLLLDKIPTRDNLSRRGVISVEESSCPFCHDTVESASHLFLHCSYTARIWYDIMRWYGVVLVLPPSVLSSYVLLVGCGSNKRRRKGLSIVWLAYVWVVWRIRNDCVFNNRRFEVVEVVDLIQRTSWQWFLNNTANGPCLLYEWVWNPGDSMLR
jgi:hypothetical protein